LTLVGSPTVTAPVTISVKPFNVSVDAVLLFVPNPSDEIEFAGDTFSVTVSPVAIVTVSPLKDCPG
jgi:hypothetical protein